jgi:hypothetical protein
MSGLWADNFWSSTLWAPGFWAEVGGGPPPADTTPDGFDFVDQVDVALGSLITSAPVTPVGYDTPAPITAVGGLYSINGGTPTNAPGTCTPGDVVRAHVSSSALYGTPASVLITIGGISADFTVTTPTARTSVRVRFKLGSLYGANEHLIREVIKDAGTQLPISIDCYDAVANEWLPNEEYGNGEYIRPRTPNGYAQRALNGGLSGGREPRWAATLTEQTRDGGIIWECAAANANGLTPITNLEATSSPAGVVIANLAVEENTKIVATYAGGELGKSYDVVFNFKIDGLPFVARQTVTIAEQ